MASRIDYSQNRKLYVGTTAEVTVADGNAIIAGNLGIGTTSPAAKLSVVGTSSITGTLTLGTTAGSNLTMLRASANYINATNATGYLVFRTSGYDTALILDTSQNATFAGNVTTGGQVTVPTGYSVNIGTSRIHSAATSYLLGGNVGIGTTSPGYKLQVSGGNAMINGGSSNSLFLSINTNYLYGDVNGVVIAGANDNFRIKTDGSERVRVTSSGNVGIGTSSPTQLLDVTGADAEIVINDSNNAPAFRFRGSGVTSAMVGVNSAKDMFFKTGGVVEQMRILANGNVGIGDTVPNTKLHVSTTTPANNVAVLIGDGWVGNSSYHKEGGLLLVSGTSQDTTQTGAGIAFQTRNTQNTNYWKSSMIMDRDGAIRFTLGGSGSVAGSEDFTILSNGNVGIGTTSPDAKLHVELNSSGATPISQQQLILENNTATGIAILTPSTTSGYLFFGDNNDAQRGYIAYAHASDEMKFKVAGSERMVINSAGSVGIGTTSPGEKLEVYGKISCRDKLLINGVDTDYASVETTAGQIIARLDTQDSLYELMGNFANTQYAIEGSTNTGNVFLNYGGSTKLQTTNTGVNVTGTAQMDTGITEGIHYVGTAVEHWGDGGTGMSFPANDTLSLKTASSDRLYINSTGNVGIGTTSPDVKLEVSIASPTDGIVADFVNSTNAGGTIAAIKLSNADSEACDVVLGANRVGANFGSDFFISLSDGVDGSNQERFRITEAGNVGIGTTSPYFDLDVAGDIRIRDQEYLFFGTSGSIPIVSINCDSNGDMVIDDVYNNSADVLFNIQGNIGMGNTAPAAKLDIVNTTSGSSSGLLKLKSTTQFSSQPGHMIDFIRSNNTIRGFVGMSQYGVTYSTSSDYRLKRNIVPIADSIDRIKKLKPSRFNWDDGPDDYVVDGFIAHEVADVIPEAITGEKDDVDKNNAPIYQSIDQSKIVPLLTAALQEAVARIEALELKISKLNKQ